MKLDSCDGATLARLNFLGGHLVLMEPCLFSIMSFLLLKEGGALHDGSWYYIRSGLIDTGH
jgi:hypothetical protein